MEINTTTTLVSRPNRAGIITHAFSLALITLAIIFGNALVVIIIRLDRRLHSPTFYFLGNLATADLLVGVGYVPFYMASVVKQAWLFGGVWCKGHAFVVSASMNASLMTLCLVSVDRYLDITDPLRYSGRMTKKKTRQIIVFIWAHSIFWAGMPLVNWGEIIFDSTTNTCRPAFATSSIANRVYGIMLVIFAFGLPVLVTVYSYIKIFRVAENQSEKIAKGSVRTTASTSETRKNTKRYRPIKNRKAHKTVLIIIGAFVACWLPYSIGTIWKLLTDQALDSYWFAHIGLTLALASSAINPVIYTVRDRRFRRGVRKKVLNKNKRSLQSLSGSASNSTHHMLSRGVGSKECAKKKRTSYRP